MAINKNNVINCKVSSVLNKDIKNFGKQNLLDGKEDTCWNSEKGITQWIQFEFKSPLTFSKLAIQFQGGFAGSKCYLKINGDENFSEPFYPDDNNSLQYFPLNRTYVANSVTVHFETSTDLFGRIIVYNIDLCQ